MLDLFIGAKPITDPPKETAKVLDLMSGVQPFPNPPKTDNYATRFFPRDGMTSTAHLTRHNEKGELTGSASVTVGHMSSLLDLTR